MSAAKHTPGQRALTDEQMRVLREVSKASSQKIGLRVSYWPGARSLFARGLVEKRGRSTNRHYFITEAGRTVLENYRDADGRHAPGYTAWPAFGSTS